MSDEAPAVTASRVWHEGRQFTVVLISPQAMDSGRREQLRVGLSVQLQEDVVLAARREDGGLRFYGERALTELLASGGPSALHWVKRPVSGPNTPLRAGTAPAWWPTAWGA